MQQYSSHAHGAGSAPTSVLVADPRRSGSWLSFCVVALDAQVNVTFGALKQMRRVLPGETPLVSIDSVGMTVAFEVEGDVAAAVAQSISIVWDALESCRLDEGSLRSVQLVPAGEIDGGPNDGVPYFSGEPQVADAMRDRTLLDAVDASQIASPAVEAWRLSLRTSSSDRAGPMVDASFLVDHPSIALCVDRFTTELQALGPLAVSADLVAGLALRHFVRDTIAGADAVVGVTEASALMGLSHQRLSQIAREGGSPKPIAWIGGKRPVWLSSDIVQGRDATDR
ncbi:MAG TPA: hypothetical protein VGO60_18215 [Iamia sp.]|jgi:hypothetical protein|nr:hypothetical protein [Iamia sp.]